MKFVIFSFVIVLSSVAVLFTLDEGKVRNYTTIGICKESLLLVTTRPSAIEINNSRVVSGEMSKEEASKWINSLDRSDGLKKSMIEMLSDRSVTEIFASIDYSGEKRLIGDYRSEFICGFVTNVFGDTVFETITDNNKTYSFSDIFFIKDRPKNTDISGNLSDITFVDRINYLVSLVSSDKT